MMIIVLVAILLSSAVAQEGQLTLEYASLVSNGLYVIIMRLSMGVVSCPDRFLLCWGRERKGLCMWFCVTANAQNLGVIFNFHFLFF